MAFIRAAALAAPVALGLALAACQQNPFAPAKPNPASRATLASTERKTGLWEQKVSTGTTSQVTRLCLDAASHSAMAYLGASLNAPPNCSSHTMTPSPDGSWTFQTVCKSGGVDVTTNGTATGDFTKGYQLRMESTAPGQAPQRFVVDAAWKGPCPADMVPGDIVGADGAKHRIAEMKVGSAS